MQSLEQYFLDWEESVFGCGYGTGERPILTVCKDFFDSIFEDRRYSHEILEPKLGAGTCWLFITTLNKADLIEWGTSARYGWLTVQGQKLKEFFDQKTVDQLYDLIGATEEIDNRHCTPSYCNCVSELPCNNPFWVMGQSEI
jgi:hypothetical protein